MSSDVAAEAKRRFAHLDNAGRTAAHDDDSSDALDAADRLLEERAERFFDANIFSMFVCMLSGLLSLMYVPSVAHVLITTRRSDSGEKAFTRYLSTLNHVLEWYSSTEKRSRSLDEVRRIHHRANSFSSKSTSKGMSQFDMVVTQWAFVGPALIFPHKLGLSHAGDDDLVAMAHQMYLVGKALGVRDEFNLCRGRLEVVQAYCHEVHANVIQPGLQKHGKKNAEMAQYLLEGAHMINPLILPRPFLAWTFRLFDGDSWKDKAAQLPPFEAVMFYLQLHTFDLALRLPWTRAFLRPVVNFLMKLNIFLTNNLQPVIKAVFSWTSTCEVPLVFVSGYLLIAIIAFTFFF